MAAGKFNRLRISCAAENATPIDAVSLPRIGRHLDQARFDHYLLGRLVELGQDLADVVDVGARLAEEKSVCPLVNLRRFLARHLGRDEDRHVFRSGVTELVAVALGRLGGAFGAGFDVVDVLALIEEEALGFDDDGNGLERGHIFKSHGDGAGHRFAHHHVDLRLSGEEPQHLAHIIALKFTDADAAILGHAVGFHRSSSRRLSRGGRSGCSSSWRWRRVRGRSLHHQELRAVARFGGRHGWQRRRDRFGVRTRIGSRRRGFGLRWSEGESREQHRRTADVGFEKINHN